MTVKQEKFVQIYFKTGNATQSYKAAGYTASSDKVAGISAHKLLKNASIVEALAALKGDFAEKNAIDIAWVRERFQAISDRCMTVIPVMVFNPATKEMEQETALVDGEIVGVFKFDSSGANKATEALGKHVGFFEKDNEQQKQEGTVVKVGYGSKPESKK